MPLPGGAADKVGNSYERRWTTLALVQLLDGTAESIRIEVPGAAGLGAEFRLTFGDRTEWHQAKRQRSAGAWTVPNMRTDGILGTWWAKLAAGDHCLFVSGVGAPTLLELADRARSASDWSEFDSEFLSSQQSATDFTSVKTEWGDPDPELCFEALKRVDVRTVDERTLSELVKYRLAPVIAGDPAVVAAVLAQYVDDSVHIVRRPSDVWAHLEANGFTPAAFGSPKNVAVLATRTATFLSAVRSLQIGAEGIAVPAIDEAVEALERSRRLVLVGGAGSGKSFVLAGAVEHAQALGWPCVVVSADRLHDVRTTDQVGLSIGLESSPVAVLAALARGSNALLAIDQLDAVGIVSGRHPERLSVVAEMLQEARAHPNVRVLVACREFDLDNDRELRRVVGAETERLKISLLTRGQVMAALVECGISEPLSDREVEFLQTPLHLAIFTGLQSLGHSTPAFPKSTNDLFGAFWTDKRNACAERQGAADHWLEVIDVLVSAMSNEQALSVPEGLLDPFHRQVAAMRSESVLTTLQGRTGFVHETFFDYCWARRFVSKSQSLQELLLSSEQDLFRRSQVRQLLDYKRGADPESYAADLKWLLESDDVRLHIKVLVLGLIGSTTSPSAREWRAVQHLGGLPGDSNALLLRRLWPAIRQNDGWFSVLLDDGQWERWLASSEDERHRALWLLAGMARHHGSEVVRLIRDSGIEERNRRAVLDFTLQTDWDAAPEVVDLATRAIQKGAADSALERVWFNMLRMKVEHAAAACAVVGAVVERLVEMSRSDDDDTRFDSMLNWSQDASSELLPIASASPAEFTTAVLPAVVDLAKDHAQPDWRDDGLTTDSLFRYHSSESHVGLSSGLLMSTAAALKELASREPETARHHFDELRAEQLEAAWFLCARGYTGNPAEFAVEAADWLVSDPAALSLGYNGSQSWTSRELIQAISPSLDEKQLNRLVNAVVGFTTSWERTKDGLKGRGYSELCLLNGVPEDRLDPVAFKRLQELRRKFNTTDVPIQRGSWGGIVPAPIPSETAKKMSDDQWVRAMKRYGETGTSFRNGRVIGDAFTQSLVLADCAENEPERFARLFLTLDDDIPGAYPAAIMRGISGADIEAELLASVLDRAIALDDPNIASDLIRFIEGHASRHLPESAFEYVTTTLASHPHPEADPDWPDSEDEDGAWATGIDSASLNSVRGVSARCLGVLVNTDPLRLDSLRAAFDSAVSDPTQQVRAAACRSLAAVLYIDAPAALQWFDVATTAASHHLLGSMDLEFFIFHGIARGHLDRLQAVLDMQSKSRHNRPRRSRARQLTVASIRNDELDSAVDRTMLQSPEEHASVVSACVENLDYGQRLDRLAQIVADGLRSSIPKVREAAARVFFRAESLDEHTGVRLFDAVAEHEGNAVPGEEPDERADALESALMALDKYRRPLPPSALRICEKWIERNGEKIGDISTSAAAGAMYVVPVVVRFHAQVSDVALRKRCLDVVDQLVLHGAHGIEERLSQATR